GEHAPLVEIEGRVERGLATHGRQQGVGMLPLDNLGHDVWRDWLNIGRIRQFRIGHDGGWIGVDQHDAIALGLEGLAGLGARIVELAGLPDDDWTRADDEDGVDVGALRHEAASYCSPSPLAIAGPAPCAAGREPGRARPWEQKACPYPVRSPHARPD